MFSKPKGKPLLARLLRPTISLRRFLIVVALAGPASAALYNYYFRPDYDRTWFDALRTQRGHTDMIADVVWRHSTWHADSELAFVIVRPSDTGMSSGPWYGPPSAEGISICGDSIFVNGARFNPQQTRCCLVFDAFSQSFLEFPLDIAAKSHDEITGSTAWKNLVIPAAAEVLQRQEERGDFTGKE